MPTYRCLLFLFLTAAQLDASDGTVSITPDSLAFGPWRTNEAITDTVQVVNISTSVFTLAASAMDVSGPFLSPSPITPATLEPGETAYVPVSFTPPSVGNYSATFDLEMGGILVAVPVSGEGVRETLVVNEILADPPAGDAGDANNDGTRHSSEDEFVELLNISYHPIDIGDHTLSDRGAKPSDRFAFPPGIVLGPGERLVLFGGGTPAGFPGQVFTDDGKIGGGLTNSGDAVYLITSGGDTLSAGEYGKEAGADQSIVRHPDGRGPFVKHKTAPSLERFSPGRIRSPAGSIRTTSDTASVLLGSRIAPAVFAITEQDTVDITSEVLWSSADPSILTGDSLGLTAILPGSTQVIAHFDTLLTDPVRVVSRLPDLFVLKTTPTDTVILRDTHFAVHIFAEAGNTLIPVENLVSWESSDPGLADRISMNVFGSRDSGAGYIEFRLGEETTALHLTSAEPGDFDLDGVLTTADVLRLIHIALEIPPLPEFYEWLGADANQDDAVDVADLVLLVEQLIGVPANTKPQPVTAIHWEQVGTTLHISGSSAAFLVVKLDEPGAIRSASLQAVGTSTLWVLQTIGGGRIDLPMSLQVTGTVREVRSDIRLHNQILPHIARPLTSFPNPFNAQTIVSFAISDAQNLTLDIYSVIGQRVARLAEGLHDAGSYRFYWDGQDGGKTRLGSGVYLAQLTTSRRVETIRMLLLQ